MSSQPYTTGGSWALYVHDGRQIQRYAIHDYGKRGNVDYSGQAALMALAFL